MNFLFSVICVIFSGPFIHPIIQVLMIQITQYLTVVLGENYLYKATMKSVFDCVLNMNGYQELTVRGKYLGCSQTTTRTKKSSGMKASDEPYVVLDFIGANSECLVSLAILFMAPGFGPYIAIFLFSINRGINLHGRYFELKGMDYRQKKGYVSTRRTEYIMLGAMTGLLTLLPIVSAFFTVTNICAAALWSIDIEERNQEKFRQFRFDNSKKNKDNRKGPFTVDHAI